MDGGAWMEQWEKHNGSATWAAYRLGEPGDPAGVMRPFRRPRTITDAQWRERIHTNAIGWMLDADAGLRATVMVGELGFWRDCGRGRCRRDRRCAGLIESEADLVPLCCANTPRGTLVNEARLARDRATWALIRNNRAEPRE